jgi:pimeloyl-ACP methyl ester carboxylesterase
VRRFSGTVKEPSVDPVQLYYESHGQGDPLLCLHGFGASLFGWREFVQPFSKGNQLILIDLKGHGKSPKPHDNEYSVIDHATLVQQFILDHDLRNLTLIGNSLGGAISLLVTIMLMDEGELGRLRAIVLIDAGAYGHYIPAFLKLLALPVIDLLAYLVPSRVAAKRVLHQAYYDPGKITEAQIKGYATPLSAPGARHALVQTAKQLIPPNLDELVKKYKQIRVPTLIIWGRQDRIIPLKVGELLDQDIPTSTLKIIEECGHAPHEEKPEETIPIVLDFLKSL